MSFSKAHLFPVPDQETAQLARAIGHPARIAILRIMAQESQAESKMLSRSIPLSEPTVQQHLNYLLKRDIIAVDIRPKKARYRVNWVRFEGLQVILGNCFTEMNCYSSH